MRCLLVTGKFDTYGGRPSKIGQIVAESIVTYNKAFREVRHINGGRIELIPSLVRDSGPNYDIIFWFPDVADRGFGIKYVDFIKNHNQKCVLVTSKNNIDCKYSISKMVQGALKQKANLFVELQKRSDKYIARVLDPLGNQFSGWSDNFSEVTTALVGRAIRISDFTRVPSSAAHKIETPYSGEFIKFVRSTAERIGRFFQPSLTHRFVGNASFKKDDMVFITRRNIDKATLHCSNFVGISNLQPRGYSFHGQFKPSVDSPIHLRLYEIYPEINYIVHGHAYINGFVTTETVVPCGSLEEADLIHSCFPDKRRTSFALNLKGHGFIALANEVDALRDLTFNLVPRPLPEMINE